MDFTGYQIDSYNPAAAEDHAVTVWAVATSDYPYWQHTPFVPGPVILAKSWGSKVSAPEAVESLLGAVPYYYNTCTDVVDTPRGLARAIKRMRTPESLYKSRQKRIAKKLRDQDPLFYDQMVDRLLAEDPWTLDRYRQSQAEKRGLLESTSITADDVGHLWINPDGKWLQQYDWPEIREELSRQASQHECIYRTWDRVAEMFGILEQKKEAI